MPRRRPARVLIATLVLSFLAIGSMGAGVGYLLGAGNVDVNHFSPDQEEFMRGLVAGTQIRSNTALTTYQVKEATCAGQFYPVHPAAMQGCLAALKDPGPGGYKLPG